jgi:hypothetical protein
MKYLISRIDCPLFNRGVERLSGLSMGDNLINVLHKRDYFVKLKGALELINVSSARSKFLNSRESHF